MEDRQEVRWSFAEVNQTGNPPTNFPCFGGRFEMPNSEFCNFYVCVTVILFYFFHTKN